MPADALTTLRDMTAQQRARLSRSHPQAITLLTSSPKSKEQHSQTASTSVGIAPAIQQTVSDMSREEYLTIMKKLQDAAKLKAGSLDQDLELYLEQQLQDLFGFEVTTEHGGVRLTHTIGVIESLQHRKRTPTDSETQHPRVPEAGFTTLRSAFGWMNPEQLTKESIEMREVYGIALPRESEVSFQATAQKWRDRKLLLLNPFEYRGVIAHVADTYHSLSPKYQFGGTPELIRDGLCWSPHTLGRVLLFILPDEKQELLPGPINCSIPNS